MQRIVTLQPCESRWPRVPLWAVAMVVVWAGTVAAVWHAGEARGHTPQLCVFKQITGLPCPTCGTGRMVLALCRGDVAAAAAMNPLMFVLAAGGTALLGLRTLFGRRRRVDPPGLHAVRGWQVLLAAALANWAYLILAGR